MAGELESTLELDDPKRLLHQRRETIAERLSWVVVLGILVLAMLGYLGPGPMSHQTSSSKSGDFAVEYYSMERYEAPSKLEIRFRMPDHDEGFLRIAFARNFVDETTKEQISPEPDHVEIDGDKLVYVFPYKKLGGDGKVVYRFRHNTFGSRRYTVGLVGGPEVDISQFVFP